MRKIGFVIPWYGDKIPGGAEAELRGIAKHLQTSGMELEILTTCVREFSSDWSVNFYKEGPAEEGGLKVIRFPVRKRDTTAFDEINLKFIKGIPVTPEEEQTFMREMVNSPKLYEYIEANKDDYALFVHIPYMFGTAYYGIQVAPEKSVLIPCLHEEAYAHISLYKDVFSKLAGMIYLSRPEMELANSLYDLSGVKQAVLGAGVDSDFEPDPDRFREKFKLNDPFILYAGRKDTGKNVDVLIRYFREFRRRNPSISALKLVLIGGGKIDIPSDIASEVIDLGFVDREDKYDACAASLCLCQPSTHESFSIVIMESWLCERPVLVHEGCDVTTAFAKESNSGLYFNDFYDFEGAVKFFIDNPDKADTMGRTGRQYVLERFTWDVIKDKFTKFFKEASHDED
ncbi:MAG: glycosyltransferase family 4 protein [Clostridiales bacterium]|nr:glycosyltransferase family 4 protein [Clostridiales bacterium]